MLCNLKRETLASKHEKSVTYFGPPSLWHLLGNVKGAVFLTQVHPVPAQADFRVNQTFAKVFA